MKKFFLLLFFFVVLSSFASAVTTDGLTAYFDFDNNFNDIHTGLFNLSENGTVVFDPGIINQGANFTIFDTLFNTTIMSSLSGSVTYCGWIITEDSTASNRRVITSGTLGVDLLLWFIRRNDDGGNSDNAYGVFTENGVTTSVFSGVNVVDDNFHFVCVNADADNNKAIVFVDGVVTNNISKTIVYDNLGSSFILVDPVQPYKDLVDELSIWNISLTKENMTELYNGGVGLAYPFVIVPKLTINTDLVNNTINYNNDTLNITYNGTLQDMTNELFNCTLLNKTNILNTTLNANLTINNKWILDFTNVQADYFFKINCTNSEASDETEEFLYRVDTINPLIVSDFVNNTIFQVSDNLVLNVTFSDPNQFSYNITFFDSGLAVLENIFASNLTGGSFFNQSSRVLSTVGSFSIRLESWDSHTTLLLKENYKIDSLVNGIEFNDNIKIYDNGIDKIESKKEKDRYTIKVFFNNVSLVQKVKLSSATNLLYLPNSKYKGHFISIGANKWIDFENDNVKNIEVEKVTNKLYYITLYLDKKTNVLDFNSIGDLNKVEETYFYSVVSAPDLNTQLLTSINQTLNSISLDSQNIEEGTTMNWIMFFIALFMIVGIITRLWVLWSISGAGFFLIWLNYGERFVTSGTSFHKAVMWGFLFLSIGMFILGILLQIAMVIESRKAQSNDFYNINY